MLLRKLGEAFLLRYLLNMLVGKDFVGVGKKDNQTLSVNVKGFFGGGRNIIPLLRDENGTLAVDVSKNKIYDYEKAYEQALDDIFQLDLSSSYKWYKPKTTHEIYLNIYNVTGNNARLEEYYDENEPNSIGYAHQFELFPNLMYRVYF